MSRSTLRRAVLAALLLLLAVPAANHVGASTPTAVPLAAPRPSWFTEELAARVHAAGTAGVPIPADARLPASALAFTGIRPGSWMLSPSGCTLNFVFGPRTHIGTAGHCTEVGDRVVVVAAPGVLMEIGTTVRSVDNGIGDDFALIEIDAGMRQYVNPSMAYFAGPTGTGNPTVGSIVEHAGHGLVIGTGGTPRVGVVTYRGAGDEQGSAAFGWNGAATFGDSGSPVRLQNGLAAGDLTHLVVGGKYLPATIAGTTAARMEQIAGLPIAEANLIPNPLF
jgi:hypothetical protein